MTAIDNSIPESSQHPGEHPSELPDSQMDDESQAQSDDSTRRRRVLMLTHRLPYPPDRGDRIRTYNMVKVLSKHFDVGLACTSEDPVWLQHHQLMMSMAKRVAIQPLSGGYSKVRGVCALLTGGAVTPAAFFRQGLADTILQWHEQQPFDAVLTVCTSMIHYANLLENLPSHIHPPEGTPKPWHVIDLMDVDSEKWLSYSKETPPPMKWVYGAEAKRLRKIEAGKSHHYDAVTVVSDAEAQAYRDHVNDQQRVMGVNNGVDMDYFAPMDDPDSQTMVFVGVLNYRPNADGVCWFVEKVMPLLRERVDDAKFMIVGRHPTPRIEQLNNQEGVEVIGSVPDVRPYLEESSAVVAPLLIARGVQNKVLEAMSCGRTVVCSKDAAEGIDATAGEHLVVADSPEDWADHLAKVMTDPEYRAQIAKAARQRIEERYSWEACLQPLVDLLQGE